VILAIETSCGTGGVALISSGGVTGEITLSTRETYSRRLVVAVEWLLARTAVTWADLRCVAVGLGPGSFTGLRIGLSAAKGFAYALGIPIYGIPTLDALAWHVTGEVGDIVCPVLDARRAQVYAAWYSFTRVPGPPVRESAYLVLSPEALPPLLPEKSRILFPGDGFRTYSKVFGDAIGDRAVPVQDLLSHPRAAGIGFLAREKISRGEPPHDIMTIEPIYVRPSEAEVKREAGNHRPEVFHVRKDMSVL